MEAQQGPPSERTRQVAEPPQGRRTRKRPTANYGTSPKAQGRDRDEDVASISGGRMSRAAQISRDRRLIWHTRARLPKVRLHAECA